MTQASTHQIYGDFAPELPDSEEYLTIHFSPSAAARKKRWSNYGLSADFLGDYFANFFPGSEVPGSRIDRREIIKGAVSYLANELIENAMKYSDQNVDYAVSISLYLYEQEIVFIITNYANQQAVDRYQNFIQELLSSDIDDFYTRQLEKTALGDGESNMGLLTLINDYSARLGWKFSNITDTPDIYQVTVMAHLEV